MEVADSLALDERTPFDAIVPSGERDNCNLHTELFEPLGTPLASSWTSA